MTFSFRSFFIRAMGLGSLICVASATAGIQCVTLANLSCEQLLAGSSHWKPTGTIHIGWSHPDIHGGVDIDQITQSAENEWHFSMQLHLTINYFGDHSYDDQMSNNTCQNNSEGHAQLFIPSDGTENLKAVVINDKDIKVSGTVTAQILGTQDTFPLDDNVALVR